MGANLEVCTLWRSAFQGTKLGDTFGVVWQHSTQEPFQVSVNGLADGFASINLVLCRFDTRHVLPINIVLSRLFQISSETIIFATLTDVYYFLVISLVRCQICEKFYTSV